MTKGFIILNENLYTNITKNWSTYETILLDSIICYLLIYCFDNYIIIQQILLTNEYYITNLKNLIEKSQTIGNHRITIMTQLLLLICSSYTKNDHLFEQFFISCLNYIKISLENDQFYHCNRIPMNLFFKSLIHIVKYDCIQYLIYQQYLNLFITIIIDYERKQLYNHMIYNECTMITFNILWSLSFNEKIICFWIRYLF